MKTSIIISIIRTYISIELITFFNCRQTVNFNRQIDHLNKIFQRQARLPVEVEKLMEYIKVQISSKKIMILGSINIKLN